MDRPADAKYTKTHEWVKVEGDIGVVGLTDYAVEHLSDLVYVELPPVGTQTTQNEAFGEIESVKAVVDLNSPISGEITEINEGLPDQLELLSDDTFGAGWMIKVKMSDAAELETLMDLVEVHLGRLQLLLAIGVDERVLHDLEEPRLEVGALGETGVVLVRLEVGLLDEVLGVFYRAGHAQGALVELVAVR